MNPLFKLNLLFTFAFLLSSCASQYKQYSPQEIKLIEANPATITDPYDMATISKQYLEGEKITQDCNKFYFWEKKAAMEGMINAAYNLVLLHNTEITNETSCFGQCFAAINKNLIQAAVWCKIGMNISTGFDYWNDRGRHIRETTYNNAMEEKLQKIFISITAKLSKDELEQIENIYQELSVEVMNNLNYHPLSSYQPKPSKGFSNADLTQLITLGKGLAQGQSFQQANETATLNRLSAETGQDFSQLGQALNEKREREKRINNKTNPPSSANTSNSNLGQSSSSSSQYCVHEAVSTVANSYTSNQGHTLIVGCYELKLKNGITANDTTCNSTNVTGVLPYSQRYKPARCQNNVTLIHPENIAAMGGNKSHQMRWSSSVTCQGSGDVESYIVKFNDGAVKKGITAQCQ